MKPSSRLGTVLALGCLLGLPGGSSEDLRELLVDFVLDGSPVLFPRTRRLSAYLCVDRDRAVRLSREMSRNGLIHEVREGWPGFLASKRLRDPGDHRDLHVLDLDCEFAGRVLREAASSGMFASPMKWLLLARARADEDVEAETLRVLEDAPVYPDSDVVLATRLRVDFVRVTSVYRPSSRLPVLLEDRGNWTLQRGFRASSLEVASRRRRDLRLTTLTCSMVIMDPDTLNHLLDHSQASTTDTVSRINYPWILQIASRMNATMNFSLAETWGYPSGNGSWNGIVGQLHRREADIGGSAMFITHERLDIVDFVSLYVEGGGRFVFRKPLLSTVSNIFVLPFHWTVWLAIGAFLLLVLGTLHLSTEWERRRAASARALECRWEKVIPTEQRIADNCFVVLGAVAQQGYTYEPYTVSTRIVTLMLLIASINLYTFYTANIVGLVQSTANSISTITDLLESPIKLGVHDNEFNRHFFKKLNDPLRSAIYERKIEPKGQTSAWMGLQEGLNRVRTDFFAFHGPFYATYRLIEETYQEEEKCGLTEVDYYNAFDPMMIVQKRSPYLEMIKCGAFFVQESGLKRRELGRVFKGRPKCYGRNSFVTIGFNECYFALVSVACGALLSLGILVLELLWHGRGRSRDARRSIGAENDGDGNDGDGRNVRSRSSKWTKDAE